MAEYIEREATIEKLNRLCDRVCQYSKARRKYMCGACPLCDAFTVIEDDLPAADVRPVIYCKECKHRPAKEHGRIIAPKDANGYTDYNCPFVCDDSWYNRMPADDDYCSCGEKREES